MVESVVKRKAMFPASAGMNRIVKFYPFLKFDVPRERGDEPV